MRFAGRLTEWHDEKGYGFVVPNGGGERVFIHVKKFERLRRRPEEGDLLSYEVGRDAKGRLAATRVRLAGQPAATQDRTQPMSRRTRVVLGLLVLACIAFAAWRQWLPTPAVVVYGLMSVIALYAYARDKQAAQESTRRTPERELHLVSLAGGWPGALLAQGLFRHKSSKASFQWMFWVTVFANLGFMAWLLSSKG